MEEEQTPPSSLKLETINPTILQPFPQINFGGGSQGVKTALHRDDYQQSSSPDELLETMRSTNDAGPQMTLDPADLHPPKSKYKTCSGPGSGAGM